MKTNINKPVVILKALMAGQRVEFPEGYGFGYEMHDGVLYHVLRRYKDFETKEYENFLGRSDMTVNQFINLCNELSDDEVMIIGAQTVLSTN